MDTSRSTSDFSEKLTSEQVADLLGHPATVILMWVREGRFPAYKEPGSQRWWFDRDEVIGWVRQHRVVPETSAED